MSILKKLTIISVGLLCSSLAFADSVADIYNKGAIENNKGNYVEARTLWELAAEKGDGNAMYGLGHLYFNGNGVTQDYAKAKTWYELAAAKGDGNAMYGLGYLYSKGNGVTQDYAKAKTWYELAAAKGDGNAMYGLGHLYSNGNGVAQDIEKAKYYYLQSSDGKSLYALGYIYSQGVAGHKVDKAEAQKYFKKACDKNYETACKYVN